METLKSALRQLRAHPTFSALVILLLALGIGANTAIFGVVHAVLLKPLPYPESGDLVLARKVPRATGTQMPGNGEMMPDVEFLAWIEAVPKSFRALAGYRNAAVTLQRGDGAVRAPAATVTGGFFPMLGVTAWRGRLFGDDDLKPGAAPATVISYSAWQSRFNGEDNAVGQVVKLDDVAHTIIGVLPPAFEFTDPVQFWRPLPIAPNAPGQMRIQMIRVFGRLLPGTSIDVAQRELQGISDRYWNGLTEQLASRLPPGMSVAQMPRMPFADAAAALSPLQEQLARQSKTTLWLLLGAVGFVLLIACANVANLQLARAAGRKRDAAVRAALGASPTRLAMELLLENFLLAIAGGALGVLFAWWGTQALQAWLADFLPRINPVSVNAPVLGFALLLALVAGLAFGLAPAWQGSRVDLLETLKEGSHQASPAGHRWRQALVAAEVALALVLAINAGLLVKSIYQLYSTELGYRTSDVLTANLSLPVRYGSAQQRAGFANRWLASLAALPGIKAAALTDIPPLSPYQQMVLAAGQRPGANASTSAQPAAMSIAAITPEFFRATGIALKDGRFFTDADAADTTAVAIVNEEFVRQFHPEGLKLGEPINLPTGGMVHGNVPQGTIVGVVANIRNRGLESAAQPMAYFPLAQQPRQRLSAVLQFEGDAAALAQAVTAATHKIDADLALDQPTTLEQQIARQTAPRRVTLMLTGAFAAVAVLLSALGIFGVMSYTVTQRTSEIGVRMALGADAGNILRWMLGQGALAVGFGLATGLVLTFATNKVMTSLLTGITTLDPLVIATGTAVLALSGLAACLLPARRATKINPVEALRSE
ncbi:MAG TPA: ABC transporter permease [Candidatus Didemnitutus sp.]|nr:ABC transporter permease [Candidatus Didemnitutus sp.]